MRKRRVFIAILPSLDVRREIVEWQKTHAHLDVRWKKPARLHVTAVAPWYVAPHEIHATRKVLREVVTEVQPFTIAIRNVRWGPPKVASRLIWSFGRTPREFALLKRKIKRALHGDLWTGFRGRRKFPIIAHITVANFKPNRKRRLPPLNERVQWDVRASGICLVESDKRSPRQFRVIERFDFSREK